MWRVKGVRLLGLPKVPKQLVIGQSIKDAHHKKKELCESLTTKQYESQYTYQRLLWIILSQAKHVPKWWNSAKLYKKESTQRKGEKNKQGARTNKVQASNPSMHVPKALLILWTPPSPTPLPHMSKDPMTLHRRQVLIMLQKNLWH
jgi:hypothetical protein